MKNSKTPLSEQALEEYVNILIGAASAAVAGAVISAAYHGVTGSYKLIKHIRNKYRWKKSECRKLKSVIDTLECIIWFTKKEIDELKREMRRCQDNPCKDKVRERVMFLKKNLRLLEERLEEEREGN